VSVGAPLDVDHEEVTAANRPVLSDVEGVRGGAGDDCLTFLGQLAQIFLVPVSLLSAQQRNNKGERPVAKQYTEVLDKYSAAIEQACY
jgi:hypothetical protein